MANIKTAERLDRVEERVTVVAIRILSLAEKKLDKAHRALAPRNINRFRFGGPNPDKARKLILESREELLKILPYCERIEQTTMGILKLLGVDAKKGRSEKRSRKIDALKKEGKLISNEGYLLSDEKCIELEVRESAARLQQASEVLVSETYRKHGIKHGMPVGAGLGYLKQLLLEFLYLEERTDKELRKAEK